MVLLILSILFGLASIIGYIRDKKDEEKLHTWRSTIHPLLAGLSLAFMMMFLLWCMFFNEDAMIRERNSQKPDGWDRPDYVRVEGPAGLGGMKGGKKAQKEKKTSKTKLPGIYRQSSTYLPVSLFDMAEDSIIWIKIHKPVAENNKTRHTIYRIAMTGTDRKGRIVVETDSTSVSLLKGQTPQIKITRRWRIRTDLFRKRLPELDSVGYSITLPCNIKWLEFYEK